MSEKEDFESVMSFWSAFDTLETVTEDVVGEEIEELHENVKHPGIIRLNSNGEEYYEEVYLDERNMTRLREGVGKENILMLTPAYDIDYIDSLSGICWIKEQKCLFCKDIFKENLKLSEKVSSLEGKVICLQNIKTELLDQLVEARKAKDNMEMEMGDLHEDIDKIRKEKEMMEKKMQSLENELYWRADTTKAVPPPPPPLPPKSFLSSFKLTFKKKTKRSISLPENMNLLTKPGPVVALREAVLDAIKNKAYSLRPLEKENPRKKMKCKEDLGIAEILARRMAMGYRDNTERMEMKEDSIVSTLSNETVYV